MYLTCYINGLVQDFSNSSATVLLDISWEITSNNFNDKIVDFRASGCKLVLAMLDRWGDQL